MPLRFQPTKSRAVSLTTAQVISVTGSVTKSAIAVSHTGDTNEFILATITIPAGLIGPNGRVEVWATFSNNNSGNTKTPRVRWGASGAGTSGTLLWSTTNTTNVGIPVMAGIANRNSISSQISIASPAGNSMGASASALPAPSVNTGNAADIILTGQLANSGDTITLEAYRVIVDPGS